MKEWIDERHYKIKHVGEDGEFWKTYKTNVTKDTVYITEELDEAYATEYHLHDGVRIGTSATYWIKGVDDDDRKIVYEQKDGTTVQITTRQVEYEPGMYRVYYEDIDGAPFIREYPDIN